MRAIDKLGNIGNREDIEALKREVNSEMDALQARVKDQAETIIAQKAVYETLSEKLEKYKRVVDVATEFGIEMAHNDTNKASVALMTTKAFRLLQQTGTLICELDGVSND